MRIMGLDIGDVRIGIALSDRSGIIASPYDVINRKQTDSLKKILEIIEKEGIEKMIIGLPKSLDGKENIQAEKVRLYVAELKKKTKIQIEFIDERFSTVSAHNLLNASNIKGAKNKRKVVDKVAATIILQTYLDMKK